MEAALAESYKPLRTLGLAIPRGGLVLRLKVLNVLLLSSLSCHAFAKGKLGFETASLTEVEVETLTTLKPRVAWAARSGPRDLEKVLEAAYVHLGEIKLASDKKKNRAQGRFEAYSAWVKERWPEAGLTDDEVASRLVKAVRSGWILEIHNCYEAWSGSSHRRRLLRDWNTFGARCRTDAKWYKRYNMVNDPRYHNTPVFPRERSNLADSIDLISFPWGHGLSTRGLSGLIFEDAVQLQINAQLRKEGISIPLADG